MKTRTIQHEGQTLLVQTVDMSSKDNVVFAAPLLSCTYNRRTGVVIKAKVGKSVRVVNPTISHVTLTIDLARRIQVASEPVAPLLAGLDLDPASPLGKVVHRVINGAI